MNEDKIMNNSYNTGNINYESFSQPMKIDPLIEPLYRDLSENLLEERLIKQLDEKIYKHFIVSPYYEKYKNPKRIDKNDLVKMYYFFKEKLLKENSFSIVQIFMRFAEFFQVSYDLLYTEVGVLDKEGLLKELNDKFKLNKKIKTKKLF